MSATGANPPKLTYAEYKARKTRRTITHPVITDDDTVVAYRAANEALTKARSRGERPAVLEQLEAELTAAETAVREATLLLRLRALPREGDGSYPVLVAEHPPREEDHAAVQERTGDPKAKARWHTKTFGPALLSACLIEPKVTLEEANEMLADLNEGEWDALVGAAIVVNENRTDTAGLVFS